MVTITTEEIRLFYAELGSKGQKKYIHIHILNNILNCLVCSSKSLFKNVN